MKTNQFETSILRRLTTLIVLACFLVNLLGGNVIHASEVFKGENTYLEEIILHYDGKLVEENVKTSNDEILLNNKNDSILNDESTEEEDKVKENETL